MNRDRQELKSAVIDALAHEIKTPLALIKASVSTLLASQSETGKDRELLGIIDEETDRLDAIISESIEIAQIELLDLKLEKRCYDLKETIEASLSSLHRAEAGRLKLFIPEGLSPVNIDFRLARLVFRQLVDNALKYSSEDSPVSISASESGGQITIRVKDSGPGISPEEHELIFRKHYRGSSATFSSVFGTGVGLAIAKRIVDAHGGNIGVSSPPGEGCVFHVSLPVLDQAAKK